MAAVKRQTEQTMGYTLKERRRGWQYVDAASWQPPVLTDRL